MLGGRSIQLARVFGIRIGANLSWFVVLFFLIWSFSGAYKSIDPGHDTQAFALAVVTAAAYALSIILHELGHAFAAMRSGIRVARIDLWLFGGLALLDREPGSPGAEFRIAAAGPLVTLLIGVGAFVAGAAAIGAEAFWRVTSTGVIAPTGASEVLSYVAWLNGLLLLVNLIPGLPLDGGRIMRAIAWWRTGDRARAGRITGQVGRLSGFAVGALGILMLLRGASLLGISLVFIAMLLTQFARQSEASSRLSDQLGGLSVGDVMDREPVAVPAQIKLDRALDEFFLRYRWDWFPVVDAMGRFLGLVSRARVEAVPEALRAGSSVDEVTAHDTRTTYQIGVDEPIESLLASDGMRSLGALMAVDPDGLLRGVVTVEQVRRAVAPLRQGA
ncbi:MAG: site-2 protease family protein [Thermoleophilaceae bacterium]